MRTRNHFMLLCAVALVTSMATSEPAAAQRDTGGGATSPAGPIPRTPDGKPDLRGNWSGSNGVAHTVILEEHPGGFGVTPGRGLIIDPPSGIIPYQPWALAERNRRREDSNGYEDPVGHCEFYDIGRIHSFDQEILYAGDTIMITAQLRQVRTIDVSGRGHLPDGIRLWQGDSIGRWEGDTLIVDTTNFNGRPRMAIGGDFYSVNAHVVERFAMVDANTINWTMTINDPTVFMRPWTMTTDKPMGRKPVPVNYDREDSCHEGNVDLVHLRNTYEQAHGVPVVWPWWLKYPAR